MSYGTITGRFTGATGTPATGWVYFTPVTAVLDTAEDTVLLPAMEKVELDAYGSFSVELRATDDPALNPINFTYRVSTELEVDGMKVKFNSFHINVPTDSTQYLADIAPVPSSNGVAIVKGDKGDPGTDGVDGVDGKDGVIPQPTSYTVQSSTGVFRSITATKTYDGIVTLTGVVINTSGADIAEANLFGLPIGTFPVGSFHFKAIPTLRGTAGWYADAMDCIVYNAASGPKAYVVAGAPGTVFKNNMRYDISLTYKSA